MKTAFVISAAALIAIGAAVFSSTKTNAEDAFSGGQALPCRAQRCPAGKSLLSSPLSSASLLSSPSPL
jgi:hypothetical protein